MSLPTLPHLGFALLLALPTQALAAGPPACRPEGEPLSYLLHREALITRHEKLPQACLEDLFRACSQSSRTSLLDGDDAAMCSIGYEALLRSRFKGDFKALMDWWRSERVAAGP